MIKKHPRYYKGKLLKSEDFTNQELYHEKKSEYQTLAFHGSGVLRGLKIEHKEGSILQLHKGTAIDAEGCFVHVENNLELDLREIEGFMSLHGNQGYISIHFDAQQSDETYSEYSTTDTHKEFDSYVDSWKLHIQEKKPKQSLLEALFYKTMLYNENEITIYQYMPIALHLSKDIPVFIRIENKANVQGELEYAIHSSHFKTCHIKLKFEDCEYQRVDLKRETNIGGKISQFELRDMKLMIEHEELFLKGETTFELPFQKAIKEYYTDVLYQEDVSLNNEIIVGKVMFHYIDHELLIQSVDETMKTYCIQPVIENTVETILNVLDYGDNINDELIEREVDHNQEASGSIPVIFEGNEKTFFTSEISHGLGCGECSISTSLEVVVGDTTRIYSGDISLFLENEISIGICQYPLKGTFQLAIKMPMIENKKYTLRWLANKISQQIEKQTKLHLLRLKPATFTLQPKQTCTILPIFNEEGVEGDVNYELSDDRGGEINTDGVYKAGMNPGIYQIKAKYKEDVVCAYMKVVEEQHE